MVILNFNLFSSFFWPLNAVTVFIAPRTSCATALAFENAFTSLAVYFATTYIKKVIKFNVDDSIYKQTRMVMLNATIVSGLSDINTAASFAPLKKNFVK